MPNYLSPGVYVEEVSSGSAPIAGAGTSTAGFIGMFGDSIKIPKPNPHYDSTQEAGKGLKLDVDPTVDNLLGTTLAEAIGGVDTDADIDTEKAQQIVAKVAPNAKAKIKVKNDPYVKYSFKPATANDRNRKSA